MPFDDLNLEFEDEDEVKKKRNEAVHVDVDLEFQAPTGTERSRTGAKPQVPAAPAQAAPAAQKPMGTVAQIAEARQAQAAPAAKRPVTSGSVPLVPQSQGSSALKSDPHYDLESQSLVEMREQMRKVEFDASVKVAVAEFKTEIIGELLGDMKLMEHQIGQLLARMNAKHPELKAEAMTIKKILADFTAKKRK